MVNKQGISATSDSNMLRGLMEQAQKPVDDIPAMLTENEYVIPAEVVIMLGNGDKERGFAFLDEFVASIKQQNGGK